MTMVTIDALLPKTKFTFFYQNTESIQKYVTGCLKDLPLKARNQFVYNRYSGKFEPKFYVSGDGERCAELNKRFGLWNDRDQSVVKTGLHFYTRKECQETKIVPYKFERIVLPYAFQSVAVASVDAFNKHFQKRVFYLLINYSNGKKTCFPLGERFITIEGLPVCPLK